MFKTEIKSSHLIQQLIYDLTKFLFCKFLKFPTDQNLMLQSCCQRHLFGPSIPQIEPQPTSSQYPSIN